MKFYIAASISRKQEMKNKKRILEGRGAIVTSRWIEDEPDNSPPGSEAHWATIDLADIESADGLIFFSNNGQQIGQTSSGRNIELGYALANKKYIAIIGQRESVFHHLPQVEQFDSYVAFLDTLAERGVLNAPARETDNA